MKFYPAIAKNTLKHLCPLALVGLGSVILASCSPGGFTKIPDNYSNFRNAHIFASDQEGLHAGQNIINLGGNAADVTIAMGFTAMATLPAKMGFEAKGLCIGYDANSQVAFSLNFSQGDLTALHGLTALHAQYGQLSWPALLAPSHQLALNPNIIFSTALNGTTLNDTAAHSGLFDQNLQQLPRPKLQAALEVLMQKPLTYPQFAPFNSDPKWALSIGFEPPKSVKLNSNTLLTNNNVPMGYGAANVVFGAADASGLGVTCSAGMGKNYGQGWNKSVDSAIPTLEASLTLPQNYVAYNENNSRLRWLASFAGDVQKQTIYDSFLLLQDDNRHTIKENAGFVQSYCPLGLPNKQINSALQCATFSGSIAALGRASRQ